MQPTIQRYKAKVAAIIHITQGTKHSPDDGNAAKTL